MNEQYFTCLIEECAEVIKAITKAQRFGIDDGHPSYEGGASNREVILIEIGDLMAVIERLDLSAGEMEILAHAKAHKAKKLDVYGPEGTYLQDKRKAEAVR